MSTWQRRAVQRSSGSAFGLMLDCGFPLRGLRHEPSGSPATLKAVRLELVSRRSTSSRCQCDAVERLSEKRDAEGRVMMTIDACGEHGYSFEARGHGRFVASPDGSRIDCAPALISPWRWQRYLGAQVLPFVSLMRGNEVFHASAVAIGDRAVAFVGGSGAGKSTLALNLHFNGALFLADDVLAVRADGPRLLAHPGLAVAKVRRAANHLLPPGAVARHARIFGSNGAETLVAIRGAARTLPLGAICFVTENHELTQPRLIALEEPDATLLMQSSFNFVLDTATRLLNQLETCARISWEVPAILAELPPEPGPEAAQRVFAGLGDYAQPAV